MNAIFIGGPMDGTLRTLPEAWVEFRCYQRPPRISLAPPPPLDEPLIPKPIVYRRVRHMPGVAAVYWHGPKHPDAELVRRAMERVLPTG